MLNSAAFRDLSPGAKVAYIALKAKYNGRNNGFLAFGARGAGDELGMSRATGNRALQELEAHGFIGRQIEATFHSKRMSIEWVLTELKNDATGALPTKAFMRWKPSRKETEHSQSPKKSTSKQSGLGTNSGTPSGQPSPLGASPTDYKKPVSNSEPTVSEVRRERPISDPMQTHSLKDGTAPGQKRGLQSHQRDTYTSAPSGAGASEPARITLLAAVRSRIARTVDDQEILDRITPVAGGVVDHLLKHHFGNPLAQAVIEKFPGSRLRLTEADLDKCIRRHLAARRRQ